MTTDNGSRGRDKPKCGANKRQAEGTCQRPAGWGTDHPGAGRCKLHGGSTRSGKVVAMRERAEYLARTLGLPLDVTPAQALLAEVRRTAGHVAWLGERVSQLGEADLVWGVTERTERSGEMGGSEVKQAARPSVWYELYLGERKHLALVTSAALKAGVEERLVQVMETQGRALARVLSEVLAGLGLSEGQWEAARTLVPEKLRELDAGMPREGT